MSSAELKAMQSSGMSVSGKQQSGVSTVSEEVKLLLKGKQNVATSKKSFVLSACKQSVPTAYGRSVT